MQTPNPKKFVAAAGLPFEGALAEIEQKIADLEQSDVAEHDREERLRQCRREWTETARKLYSQLSPWETVQVARHKDRPHTKDYLSLVFDEFFELHGDKYFGDDRALLTGFARLDSHKVMVVGHEKGRTYQERTACYFGCAHPEGYRKAFRKMRMAEKYGVPIICLIDTPGAYPGVGAEERGQAQVIAENMFEMSRLKTPVVCVVIGEGGSGGALGIGVGDRVAMLEHAYYSVISPEGCAGILWKSHEFAESAATALKFTSRYLREFGIVDEVIQEPVGGAHRDPHLAALYLKNFLARTVAELKAVPQERLVQERYEKFRRIGVFHESAPELVRAESA
ncbi:MAG TPA: acetyl-CoA carboxylase carboxyltransferase subunit alpha [Pirellulaceae bacterium]|jgi:acetyl-CoA carboxylase carboxyl transferase subunit alpha|nr:acetyl-CoA carboxylase carboxyltransferase subunit alpha [Pirellulaceae bacterium]